MRARTWARKVCIGEEHAKCEAYHLAPVYVAEQPACHMTGRGGLSKGEGGGCVRRWRGRSCGTRRVEEGGEGGLRMRVRVRVRGEEGEEGEGAVEESEVDGVVREHNDVSSIPVVTSQSHVVHGWKMMMGVGTMVLTTVVGV